MANPALTRTLQEIDEARYETSAAGIEIPQLPASRMTVEGTMGRTVTLFGVLLVSAVFSWITGLGVALFFPAMLVGLGLALWASFSKKVRPGLYLAYAAVQGVFLAGISQIFELAYPGIVQNAVFATTITAGIMFVAYQQQWIKVTGRFRQVITFALLGYMGFAVVNLLFAMFTGGSGAYGSSFGWLIALFGVGLAAFTLVLDFADIEAAAGMGVPAEYEWRLAFGLIVSIVWMYTEILRLLAILRGND